jgi:hypothetical protein
MLNERASVLSIDGTYAIHACIYNYRVKFSIEIFFSLNQAASLTPAPQNFHNRADKLSSKKVVHQVDFVCMHGIGIEFHEELHRIAEGYCMQKELPLQAAGRAASACLLLSSAAAIASRAPLPLRCACQRQEVRTLILFP